MARFTRLQTLQSILDIGLIPLFYQESADKAAQIAQACVAGGARVIEFTNRGDFAIDVFKELEQAARRQDSPIILGAGSVVDAATAAIYIAYGANFIVSPCFDEAVARLCNKRRVPYLPGCSTIKEIQVAEEFGCEIIKIFPGEVAGPKFIKGVKGPCPQSSLMPTGGVSPTKASIEEWFKAGSVCVGMGSQLISPDITARGDWQQLEGRVRDCLAIIAEVRSSLGGSQ